LALVAHWRRWAVHRRQALRAVGTMNGDCEAE